MTWNKNPNPKSSGWYLCTVEVSGGRFVMPVERVEYPKGNFTWSSTGYGGKVVACAKFPKPYAGAIADDKYEQIAIQI